MLKAEAVLDSIRLMAARLRWGVPEQALHTRWGCRVVFGGEICAWRCLKTALASESCSQAAPIEAAS